MRPVVIPRGSRTAMALVVAAVAAWACSGGEEEGIGPCKGQELGFRCTIEGMAGVCIHSCGSDLMCVTDGRREDADNSCVDGGPLCTSLPEYEKCFGGGVCVFRTDGRKICASTCEKPGVSEERCTCYRMETDTAKWNLCLEPGTKAIGEPCTVPYDCTVGLQCWSAGEEKTCHQVCIDDCGEGCDVPCASGVCTDTELGFKVCVEGEEP